MSEQAEKSLKIVSKPKNRSVTRNNLRRRALYESGPGRRSSTAEDFLEIYL